VDKEKIYRIAKKIREDMENEFEGDLTGTCAYSSNYLQIALKEEGIDSIIIEGTFDIDNPDCSELDDEDINNECIYHPPHYWVEVEGYILDITADQFNDELHKETMPDIVFGSYMDLDRYNIEKKAIGMFPSRPEWIMRSRKGKYANCFEWHKELHKTGRI
jgi:hypothetical protein